MAYTLPTFNLTVNIFTGPWVSRVLRSSPMANFALGRRVTGNFNSFTTSDPIGLGYGPILLLPALTDVRDRSCGGPSDFVEVPASSGRYYCVGYVDDIGKGFSNEHRYACLYKVFQDVAGGGSFPGVHWPTPIP